MAAELSLDARRADILRRLGAVRAVCSGIGRFAEVTAAISACEGEQEAVDAIASLLDLPTSGARLVLDTSFRRLTRSNIDTLLAERDALEQELSLLEETDRP